MPYAERVAPGGAHHPRRGKRASLPMPVAAFHNGEESRISSLQSFVRRTCLEYFAHPSDPDANGRVGIRCAFCAHLDEEERDAKTSCVFPESTVSIHAAAITLLYAHIPFCSEVPDEALEHIEALKEKDAARAETRPWKRYRWCEAAAEMGFVDADAGMRFVPPEDAGTGRKRGRSSREGRGAGGEPSAASSSASAAAAQPPSAAAGGGASTASSSGGSAPGSRDGTPSPPPAAAVRADWTDDDDLLLWEGQSRLGNKWKEVSEQVFHSTFRGDQVRNRWYSQAFKDLVAKRFGREAYRAAQVAGKQLHSGGQGGSQAAAAWTPAEDLRLWEAQNELGNRWKDISARMGRSNSDHVKTRWYSDKFKELVAERFGPDAYREAHVAGKQERQGARPQVEWTEDDDRLLWTSCQDQVTGRNWEEISKKRFGSRMTENHLKNRWYSAAFKKFVAREHGPDAYQNAKIGRRGAQSQVDWTPDDDRVLWTSHAEMGNRWAAIAETRFAGRISENQVKNRWYSAPFKKFVAAAHGPEAHRNAKHRR